MKVVYGGKHIASWIMIFLQVVFCSAFSTSLVVIKEAFIKNDNYMKRCDYDTDCRDLLINELIFIALAAVNATGIFSVPLVEKFGTKLNSKISAPIWMISIALLMFTDDSQWGHFFRCLLMVISSFAGIQIFYIALVCTNICEQAEGDQLRTLLTMLWDLSGATGFLILFIYESNDDELDPFFIISLFGIAAGLYAVMVSFFVVPETILIDEEHGHHDGEKEKLKEESRTCIIENDNVNDTGNVNDAHEEKKKNKENKKHQQMQNSLWGYYVTAWETYIKTKNISFAFSAITIIFLLSTYFFMVTVRERILLNSEVSEGEANLHNSIFGLSVSGLSILVMPPIGSFVSKYNRDSESRHILFYPLIIAGIIHITLAVLVSYLPPFAQFFNYFLFGTYCTFTFSILNSLLPMFYDQSGYTILAINYAIGGLVTLFAPFLDDLAVLTLNAYWPVDLVIGISTISCFIWTSVALKLNSTDHFVSIDASEYKVINSN